MELSGTLKSQTKPPHIINYLHAHGVRRRRPTPFSLMRNLQVQRTLDDALLQEELAHHNLAIKVSTIPNAGDGLFTTVAIPENTVISFFYGYIMYLPDDYVLNGDTWNNERAHYPGKKISYGKFVNRTAQSNTHVNSDIAINANQAANLQNTYLKANTGAGRNEIMLARRFDQHIVTEYYCAARFINDGRQLPGSNFPAQQPNVAFQNEAPTQKNLARYNYTAVVSTRDIEANSELFVDYGQEYDFDAVHDPDLVVQDPDLVVQE